MSQHLAGGKQATKEEQPFDVGKTTDDQRIKEAGGIPVGIFTDEERQERREQYEKEGRIAPPPEQRNPTEEGEKILDQQANQLAKDRQDLKDRRAEDAELQAKQQKEHDKAAKKAEKDQEKENKHHK